VLAPTGRLAHELISMACERPVNISRFMLERAGTSSYYPTSYSVHHHRGDAGEEDGERDSSLPLPSAHPSPPSASRSSSHSCLCLASAICALFDASPHSSLQEIHEMLITYSPNHRTGCNCHSSPHLDYVPPSALFVLNPSHSEICFITNTAPPSSPSSAFSAADLCLEYVFVSLKKQFQWSQWLATLCGATVIKGTLLSEPHRALRRFLCEDIAMMNGTQLLFSNSHTTQQRRELRGVWLFDSPFDEENFFETNIQFAVEGDG
jgi:hypothetical protein